jgi:hypothetical protein
MDKVLSVNCTNGEILEEDLSASDVAQKKIDKAKGLEIDAEIAKEKIAKSALFIKLGITEDEAKLLLS